MESSTSRTSAAQRKQEELKAQIASLQAQLETIPDDKGCAVKASRSPKRKKPEPTTLAPATPSPKKKRRTEGKGDELPKARTGQLSFGKQAARISASKAVSSSESFAQAAERSDLGPSEFLSKLAAVKNRPSQNPVRDTVPRTCAFSDRTRPDQLSNESPEGGFGLKRDDRLVLVEDLERGPYEFTPPSDDLDFQKLEPHSGIRLSSRILSHEDLQDYMTARYYLSPSRLYSVVRLKQDKQSYDVPLFGDWVTIAVVAERGPVKLTRAPITIDPDEHQGKKSWGKNRGKDKEVEEKKPVGKKFVNFKLIDFGARSESSANGAQSVIRGDAFLTLLLFEADSFDLIQADPGQKPRKLYKGGSRGAFEMMAKVKEGDVIALLNPKILKPFQRTQDNPHPVNNILALTPESADSIAVIGRSRDLGMCSVTKRDGKPCGSWCDRRISDVCEYHLQNAVQHRRAGRAEFTAGTSGMSNTSAHKRKARYDPVRQWGMKPEESARGSTYVISGHVVGGSDFDPRNMYVGEMIGREGQAKAQRKGAGDGDRALKALLERDRRGMQAVMLAREANNTSSGSAKSSERRGRGATGKSEKRPVPLGDNESLSSGKNTFKAEVVKQLGFDPTLKVGQQKKPDNIAVQKKLEVLEAARKGRKDIVLGSRPGPKIRSGVVPPTSTQTFPPRCPQGCETSEANTVEQKEDNMVDLDDI